MDGLLKLPYELQIVLVAGYLAYKITTIGKGRLHRTEDFLLQVLTFGVVARSISSALAWLFSYRSPLQIEIYEAVQVAEAVFLTCVVSVALGILWRSLGERTTSTAMNSAGIYRDDHESSVWQSIMQNPAPWTVVQVFLESGIVLEANFAIMKPRPKTPVLMNEDGIGIYVTGRWNEKNKLQSFEITGNSADVTMTYIPRTSIKRVDVSWRLPDSEFELAEPIA
ncbi:hypothetical protein [Rhizobium tumorigenes]|uniref:Uncharacterized protein n=1 Tax=Rhizobium tumorigenes TaxID=2041385 RepID=A0AAF1KLG4_9HYPH|nr:hypothetical protein [Rhizobium tumorigenes]WFR96870.1 hypothetical protein PR017_07085 [Rhizobium tumorigenes]